MEHDIVVDPNLLASWKQKMNSLIEEFVNEKITLKVYSKRENLK